MSVLPDTSVWVDHFRRGSRGRAAALDGLLARNEVVVCGPVVAELLGGVATEHRDDLWLSFAGLRWAELGREQWREVGAVAGGLRARGAKVPLVDIEIAVAAVAAGAALWTLDSDFVRVSEVLKGFALFEP